MTKFNDVCQYFAMKESGELVKEFMCIVNRRICSSMHSLYCDAGIISVRIDDTVISYRKTDETDKYGSPIYKTTFVHDGRERTYLYYGIQDLLEYDNVLEDIIKHEDYSNEFIIECEIK